MTLLDDAFAAYRMTYAQEDSGRLDALEAAMVVYRAAHGRDESVSRNARLQALGRYTDGRQRDGRGDERSRVFYAVSQDLIDLDREVTRARVAAYMEADS